MRLSEHDREMVEEVARFCDYDPCRPYLCCVHFQHGWVHATDSYRLDLREVDTPTTAAVNPFDLRAMSFDLRPFDFGALLGKGLGGELHVVTLNQSDVPTVPKRKAGQFAAFCLGCRGYGNQYEVEHCGCDAPMVSHHYLLAAMRSADNKVVRWQWRHALRPIRYVEDGHLHLLMPVRRSLGDDA